MSKVALLYYRIFTNFGRVAKRYDRDAVVVLDHVLRGASDGVQFLHERAELRRALVEGEVLAEDTADGGRGE